MPEVRTHGPRGARSLPVRTGTKVISKVLSKARLFAGGVSAEGDSAVFISGGFIQ